VCTTVLQGDLPTPKLVEMDDRVTLHHQMGLDVGPVILINTFHVTPAEVDQLLTAWAADAAWMKRQPGCISIQLHRGIGGSGVFLNYAVWESVAHCQRAFRHPDFQAALQAYPPSAVASPHLFQKVAVPGICVAA
jgi:quinol monooxygenase YgiN